MTAFMCFNKSPIKKSASKNNKALLLGGYCGIEKNNGLNNGDTFTIAGMRRLKNGRITRNCKAGTETKWVAEII